MMIRTRQVVFGVLALCGLVAFATPAHAQTCGAQTHTELVAGQIYNGGTITIYNDKNYIYVQYTTNAPWVLSEAHAAVAATLDGIPQTKGGNPIPGRFAYGATFDPEVTTYTFVVPTAGLGTAGQSVFVAAHAMLQAPRD